MRETIAVFTKLHRTGKNCSVSPVRRHSSHALAVPETPQAADVKITDSYGETFTLTDAATMSYQPEGSMGGSGSRLGGINVRTPRGNEVIR
jgi:hypothetical protein